MGPESFENRISKKFENQTLRAPKGVWGNIENSLNADLVTVYAAQHSTYKWMSVAALFIATLLLGVLLLPFNNQAEEITDNTYNALLSNDWDSERYFRFSSTDFHPRDISFNPVKVSNTNKVQPVNSSSLNTVAVNTTSPSFISPKKTDLLAIETNHDIHPYYQVGSMQGARGNRNTEDSKVWAGIEAGAGTFNADFNGSGAISNSLNTAGLATAVGSGNFVNPTTNIAQDMEEGIATSLGVDFGMSIGKRWTVESGVAYTRMENNGSASISVLDVFTIDAREFVNGDNLQSVNPGSRETAVEVQNSYDHEVDLNNRMQFATIPLKAGYFVVDRKVSLRVNAGLSANYLMEGNLSDPSKQILNSDQLGLYNEWSFDGIGGVELGYSIFNKFDLTIEPNYRHSITPISNSVTSPSRFVVQTGLRYTLK